jgi:hypothetical protein
MYSQIKKHIHFSEQDIKEIDELIEIIGIKGYGDLAKALKFSVTYTLFRLREDIKVLPDLNDDKFKFWLSSIINLKKDQENIKEVKKLIKINKKVSPFELETTEKVTLNQENKKD